MALSKAEIQNIMEALFFRIIFMNQLFRDYESRFDIYTASTYIWIYMVDIKLHIFLWLFICISYSLS